MQSWNCKVCFWNPSRDRGNEFRIAQKSCAIPDVETSPCLDSLHEKCTPSFEKLQWRSEA